MTKATPSFTVGAARVSVLHDGTIALDGGAMFGVVPRVVWEKRDPPDERNRVTLGLNVALIESGGKRVLVDTGMGDRWSEKEVRMYGIDRSTTLLGGLRTRGLGPEDIDVVVNTHLHFDHAGGNTRREGEGMVPTFPRARYLVQRGEWEDARHPHERSRASYREDDFVPVAQAGQLDLIDGETEVAPGVQAVPVGGHTTHHQMVVVQSGGETLVVPTDLLPTASHLPLPFVMGYDLFPVATLEAKRRLLHAAVEGGWRILFYHDARTPVGRVRREGDGYTLEVDP
ncbi:MAG TPA: MBL fold metallo-hydrolase [Vicinamibacteria bacterium]|nr:MBL fold metallo-hydrolase [Vicinamibacteria bacterium]